MITMPCQNLRCRISVIILSVLCIDYDSCHELCVTDQFDQVNNYMIEKTHLAASSETTSKSNIYLHLYSLHKEICYFLM